MYNSALAKALPDLWPLKKAHLHALGDRLVKRSGTQRLVPQRLLRGVLLEHHDHLHHAFPAHGVGVVGSAQEQVAIAAECADEDVDGLVDAEIGDWDLCELGEVVAVNFVSFDECLHLPVR